MFKSCFALLNFLSKMRYLGATQKVPEKCGNLGAWFIWISHELSLSHAQLLISDWSATKGQFLFQKEAISSSIHSGMDHNILCCFYKFVCAVLGRSCYQQCWQWRCGILWIWERRYKQCFRHVSHCRVCPSKKSWWVKSLLSFQITFKANSVWWWVVFRSTIAHCLFLWKFCQSSKVSWPMHDSFILIPSCVKKQQC